MPSHFPGNDQACLRDAAISDAPTGRELQSAKYDLWALGLLDDRILRYIDQHPDMPRLVRDMWRSARKIFGLKAELSLSHYQDPEIEDEYLLLCVRLPKYADNTLDLIRSVTDDYEDELCSASGSILVTTDFRPTR